MDLNIKVPIFVDTNLGTHIALDVNPSIQAIHLKRELEEAHLNCFPKLRKIKINGVMVKKKSYFYHVPDSMCIKHVFQGLEEIWFIHIDASFQSEFRIPTCNSNAIVLYVEPRKDVPKSNATYTNCNMEKLGGKRILCPKVIPSSTSSASLKKGHINIKEGGCTRGELREEHRLAAISANYSDSISEAVSVSGIINKYFCDYKDESLGFEVTSRVDQGQCKEKLKTGNDDKSSRQKINRAYQFTPKTPARNLIFPSAKSSMGKIPRKKCKSGEIGKRILVASSEFGSSKYSRKSLVGLYHYKGEKSSETTSFSPIKSIVFEINDDDD